MSRNDFGRALVTGCATLGHASAYPGLLVGCDPWQAGQLGYMEATIMEDGASSSRCDINISTLLSDGVVAGEVHSITVSSRDPSLYKLHSSDGQCLGHDYDPGAMALSRSFSWHVPADTSKALGTGLTFYALCSTGFHSLVAAAPVRLGVASGLGPPTASASAHRASSAASAHQTASDSSAIASDVSLVAGKVATDEQPGGVVEDRGATTSMKVALVSAAGIPVLIVSAWRKLFLGSRPASIIYSDESDASMRPIE